MFRLTTKGLEAQPIDVRGLRVFIENAVGNELSRMAEDCYLPRVNVLFRELMFRTHTDEKELKQYSKQKYSRSQYKLLHDPQTTLLVLICQLFLRDKKDVAAALYTFNLFALRYYSNISHKYIPESCNPELFRAALERLSHSHIFRKKNTIGNSIMYFSKTIFDKYKKDLESDKADKLWRMIYEIRTRINQSLRSFYRHYYKAKEDKEKIGSRSEEDMYEKEEQEGKKRRFAQQISKDITVYQKVDEKAINEARDLTKFSRVYASAYAKAMANPEYQEMIENIYILLLRPIKKLDDICSVRFFDYIKSLMAVKTSTKPVYFKKSILELHDQYIIPALDLEKWFNGVSVQTKKISRDFVAYYLALVLRDYIC